MPGMVKGSTTGSSIRKYGSIIQSNERLQLLEIRQPKYRIGKVEMKNTLTTEYGIWCDDKHESQCIYFWVIWVSLFSKLLYFISPFCLYRSIASIGHSLVVSSNSLQLVLYALKCSNSSLNGINRVVFRVSSFVAIFVIACSYCLFSFSLSSFAFKLSKQQSVFMRSMTCWIERTECWIRNTGWWKKYPITT